MAGKEEIESGRISDTTRQRERGSMPGGGQAGSGGRGILKSVGREQNGNLRVVNE